VLTAPFDVYLGARHVFQPDILFMSHAKKHLIQKNGLYGAPDMVVEVLSIHNAHNDLVVKMDGIIWLHNRRPPFC
jgi:Uma2 family endonuclease